MTHKENGKIRGVLIPDLARLVLDKPCRAVLSVLLREPGTAFTVKEMMGVTGMSDRTARQRLGRLEEAGAAVSATRYGGPREWLVPSYRIELVHTYAAQNNIRLLNHHGHDRPMVRAGVISDELWALVEPVLPYRKGFRSDPRRALEGIVWRYRTTAPWRFVPVKFGPWQTVWRHHQRFSMDGTYQRMFDAVRSNCSTAASDDLVTADFLGAIRAGLGSGRARRR